MSLTFDKQEVLSELQERIKEYEDFIPKLKEKFGIDKKEISSFWDFLVDCFGLDEPSLYEALGFAGAESELSDLLLLQKYITKSKSDPVPLTEKQYQMVFLSTKKYYNRHLDNESL